MDKIFMILRGASAVVVQYIDDYVDLPSLKDCGFY